MSAFTFTVCGIIAVLMLLAFNTMLARYCAPRAAQREAQRESRAQAPAQHKPPVWQEAVCVANPDGSVEYAAPSLATSESEAALSPIPLQPHSAERALPRMLYRRS